MNTKFLAFCTVVAVTLGFASPSFASYPGTLPADPTGGAFDDTLADVQTWVITYGVPGLFLLTALGILIRLGRKWLRRAASSV